MIVSRYKMHIDITNQYDNHSDNLIKPAKTETKNILIREKNFKKWGFFYQVCYMLSNKNNKSLFS